MEYEKDKLEMDLDALAADVEEEDIDEDLDLSEMGSLTWLVKVPKFLAERWKDHSQLSGAGTELGRMRVYDADETGKRRIEVIIPNLPSAANPIPTNYTLDVRNQHTSNMYVFDELAKPEVREEKKEEPQQGTIPDNPKGRWKPKRPRNKVARRPRAIGTVAHECLIQPVVDESYRAVMRARQQKAAMPKRTIKRVDETDVGKANRMASGMGMAGASGSGKLAALNKPKASKSTTERFARIPRAELLDLLFEGFTRYEYWAIKSLREHTKQPESYLREVLSDIGVLLKNGPYTGHWVLKPYYKEQNMSKEARKRGEEAKAEAEAEGGEGAKKEEEVEEEDDDDDEDEEMEEVEA